VLRDDANWQRFMGVQEAIDDTTKELKTASPSLYNRTRANFLGDDPRKISAAIGLIARGDSHE